MKLATLIRHGEVDGRAFVYRGRSDPPLTQRGWAQMERAASALETPRIERLLASPSRRCRDFAERWSKRCGVPLEIDAGLREIDFGEWEELTPDEARMRDPACFARLQTNAAEWRPPRGEHYSDFELRVWIAFERLCSSTTAHVGVITHAGVIRALLCRTLTLSPASAQRIVIATGGACRLSCEPDGRAWLVALQGECA
jgi:alpha-ribazole phosphatase